MKKIKNEIENMSDDEFNQAWIYSDDLLFTYIYRVESGDDLSKIPSRDEIARACLILFVAAGEEHFTKEHKGIISEICDFSQGVSLIKIAPRINSLYEVSLKLDSEDYERENRRTVTEDDIPF